MAVLEEIRPALKDRSAGQTMIRDVRVEAGSDSTGEDAVFIVLVLGDPPDGQETWPVDDLRALRGFVREHIAGQTEIPIPWFVRFEPEHPDLDGDAEQLELGM